MASKKPLYIYLHLFKCAGITIRTHIKACIDKDKQAMFYDPYDESKQYLSSLTQEKKEKLEILFGHRTYYGMHEFFPDREVRYVTFFRNPVDRMISQYNYNLGRLKFGKEELSDKELKRFNREFVCDGKERSFEEWLFWNPRELSDFTCKNLFKCIHARQAAHRNVLIDNETLKHMKKILDKFYFIGMTENPEDFRFLYHELGVNKLYPNENISKNIFVPRDYGKIAELVLSRSKYDEELYKHALKLNKKFKQEHKDFAKNVRALKIRMSPIYKAMNFYLIPLWRSALQTLYKLSAWLKKRSKLYTTFIAAIKK